MSLGSVLLHLARFQEALDAFAQASRVDPASIDARRWFARALTELGRPAEAQLALQNAITLGPDDASLHGDLGEVHEKQGHYAFALHEFREAARLDPTSAKFAD